MMHQPYRSTRIALFLLLLTIVSFLFQFSQAQPPLECTPNNPKYEWERMNYYELLGLKRQAAQSDLDDSKDIRKAYRKQAQIWHPDKAANQNSTTATLEERTSRFARIAEGYEVLTDPPKRKEYDFFLRYCDEMREDTESDSFRWSNLFENFGEPLRVFEEFFFGTTSEEEATNDQDDLWKTAPFREASFDDSQQQQQQPPARVSKHQDILQDKFTGEEIIRMSQTEEYPIDPRTGKFYYRIMSQEFAKRFDPYTGMNLQPTTPLYLREEGYRHTSERNTQQHQQQQQQQPPYGAPPPQSLLFPGDILSPTSTHLVSPNQRYYAGLSPECELLIMADNRFGDDDLIWSSETFGNNCFATLRGPHLVIAMGRPELPHQILWYSDAIDYDDEDDYGLFQRPRSAYVAQLDNDGSLAIYKVWSQPRESQTVATKAWIATRNFLLGNTRAEYDFDYSSSSSSRSSNSITYKRCIYATGPMGCFRLARRLYQLSFSIYYNLKNIIARIDQAFDAWMDLILEEDDFARAFKEYGTAFGSQLANKSTRLVRKVMECIMSTRHK